MRHRAHYNLEFNPSPRYEPVEPAGLGAYVITFAAQRTKRFNSGTTWSDFEF